MTGPSPVRKPHAKTHAVAARIRFLAGEGFTGAEIAKRIELSYQRTVRVTDMFGIELGSARGRRKISDVGLSTEAVAAVATLAERAGVTRAVMLERLVTVALDGGAQVAARRLGKLALPVKRRSSAGGPRPLTRRPPKLPPVVDRDDASPRPEWLMTAITEGQHPVRAARLHAGLRQTDLGRLVGIEASVVSNIKRGVPPFTVRMRHRLAAVLGVEPEWLRPGGASIPGSEGAVNRLGSHPQIFFLSPEIPDEPASSGEIVFREIGLSSSDVEAFRSSLAEGLPEVGPVEPLSFDDDANISRLGGATWRAAGRE